MTIRKGDEIQGYKVLSKLGQGTYGTVYKVEDLKTKELYALKEFQNDKTLSREMLAMQLDESSPYLIRYYKKFEVNERFYVLMNLAENGTLADIIKQCKTEDVYLKETLIARYFAMLSIALAILHSHHICHHDIKPENVFRDETKNLILGDYGSARKFTPDHSRTVAFEGTPLYMAPEVYNGQRHSYPSDVWSLGVMIREIIEMEHPFENSRATLILLFRAICEEHIPPFKRDKFDPEILKLVDVMMERIPEKRPTMLEVLFHPSIQKAVRDNNLVVPTSLKPK